MKKILLTLAALLAAGITSAVILVAWFLANPAFFLPRNSVPTLAKLARLAGIHLSLPNDAKLTIRSLSFRDKRFTLDTPSLCYDGISPHASGCFGKVHAEIVLRLAAFPPKLLKIGPVTAEDGRFEVSLPETQAPADQSKPSEGPPTTEMAFGTFDVRFSSLSVSRGESKGKAKVSLQTGPVYSLVADGEWADEKTRRPFSVAVRAEGTMPLIKGKVEGWIEKPIPQLSRVELEACGFDLQNLGRADFSWKLLCPVDVTPTVGLVPKEWTAGWNGKVRLLVHGMGDRKFSGTVEADLLPLSTGLLHGRGKIILPLEVLTTGKGSATVETEIHIVDFRKVKKLIDDKPYAVPSPLNSLKGELRIATDGKAEIDTTSGRIPFQIHTRLGADGQTFNVGAAGALTFRSVDGGVRTDLDLNLSLADVALVLPPLDPRRLPRIIPDSRIHLGAREIARAPSPFHYKIKISTQAGRPIRLISNLASAPVPVELDLAFGSDIPFVGNVRIATFPAQILRRKAMVRYFKIDLSEKFASPPLSGEIDVEYSLYRLKLLIHGTVDSPHLTLLSDPPLSEEDVYSVLVFGRPLEELTPKDGDTVANLRAALSNRAVGLASMYLLATTPVESVTYDPGSNQFSAKIRIADGTSLTVGSDLRNLNQLGVKRRIGPSWILNTFIDNPFGTRQQRSVSSFLEWSKRY